MVVVPGPELLRTGGRQVLDAMLVAGKAANERERSSLPSAASATR